MKIKVSLQKQDEYDRDKIIRMLFLYEYQNGTCRTIGQELGWGKTKTADLYRACRGPESHTKMPKQ